MSNLLPDEKLFGLLKPVVVISTAGSCLFLTSLFISRQRDWVVNRALIRLMGPPRLGKRS